MTSDTYQNMSASMAEIKEKCSEEVYIFIRGHIADLEREINYLSVEIEAMESDYRPRRSRYAVEDDWK